MCVKIECVDNILSRFVNIVKPKRIVVSIHVVKSLKKEFLNFLYEKEIDIDREPDISQDDMVKKGRFDKFIMIASYVYRDMYNDALYRLEDKKKRVTAMKFKTHQSNARVYCREIENTIDGIKYKKVIIASIVYHKQNQENRQKEKSAIKKAGEYEFEK